MDDPFFSDSPYTSYNNLCEFDSTLHSTRKCSLVLADSASVLSIVVSDSAGQEVGIAVKFLASVITRMSGVAPTVLSETNYSENHTAIRVGLDDIFPQELDGVLIDISETGIKIEGRDRHPLAGKEQQEFMLANAVYSFIQDVLEVNWYFPNEEWLVIKERQSLVLNCQVLKHNPQFKSRGGLLRFTEIGYKESKSTTLEKQWATFNRLRLSSYSIDGGHAFVDWWERFGAEHPEYFALTNKGRREPLGDPGKVKLCVSQVGVVDEWLRQVNAELVENRDIRIFNGALNDSWSSGHCECSDCKELDVHGVGDEMRVSDRYIHFANNLSRGLGRTMKCNYLVQMLAYGKLGMRAPLKEIPDSNVLIVAVPNILMREDKGFPELHRMKDELKKWSEISTQWIWRPNVHDYMGFNWGLYDYDLRNLEETFRYISDLGAEGVYIDTYAGNWSNQGILYFISSKLAWDSQYSHKRILDQFFNECFPNSKQQIKAYYDCLSELRSRFLNYGNKRSRYALHQIILREDLEHLKTLLSFAHAKAKNDTLELKRVEFISMGLIHLENIIKLRSAVRSWERTQSRIDSLRVVKLFDSISEVSQEFPVHSINKDLLLNPKKLGSSSNIGLHILNPMPKQHRKNYIEFVDN